MALVFETKNFIVEAPELPHVSRLDGGHLRIFPKVKVLDRQQFSPKLAIELMRLSIVVGDALRRAMTKRGIKIMRINYQDMGNWAFKTNEVPFFHLQIYGRAFDSKVQPYKEAVYLPGRSTGFYDKFEPLDAVDIKEIKKLVKEIFEEEKYADKNWGL